MTEPRFDPNTYHELEDMAQWQSIVDLFGDAATDASVMHEPSAYERRMALLTYRPITDPTNTVALQTAPEFIHVGRRSGFFLGVAVALSITVGVAAIVWTALGVLS